MSFQLTLLASHPYSTSPQGAGGWLIWAGLLVLIGWLLYAWRGFNKPWGRTQIIIFVSLILITPLTSLFFGIQSQFVGASPMPGLPAELFGQEIMLFAALPWMLAGGLLGPFAAAVVGLITGVFITLWNTHDPFTVLGITLLAILFSVAMLQRYRTAYFRMLRQPVFTALLFIIFFPVYHFITAPFTISGPLAVQLEFASNNLASAWLVFSCEILIAALIAQISAVLLPTAWGSSKPLTPSPSERSLFSQLSFAFILTIVLQMILVVFVSWQVASWIGQDMLKTQMSTVAQGISEQVPIFLQTGQNALSQVAADLNEQNSNLENNQAVLAKLIKSVPFFNQLVLLDGQGKMLSSYPDAQNTGAQTPIEEKIGIQMASRGFLFQTATMPPSKESSSAQVSFITPVIDNNGNISKILIGRASLSQNPFAGPLLTSLKSITRMGGQGIVLDENGRILVHPDPALLWSHYSGQIKSSESFFEEISPDGNDQFVFFKPLEGTRWSLAIWVPTLIAKHYLLRIAMPILAAITALALLSILLLNRGLRVYTKSLSALAAESEKLAEGKFDQPIIIDGEDEIAQLRRALETMRISVRHRVDELNKLLSVSQGVASNLDIEEAMKPVLESALRLGASTARVVMLPSVVPDWNRQSTSTVSYNLGITEADYSGLDEQILALCQRQDRLILTELTRPRLLNLTPGLPRPTSLMAAALRHENQYHGALWIGYDQSHSFTDEEVRFVTALANQAAIAASNAHSFLNAEIGRQRLAAILASSPDPILVIDQHNYLTLSNPAAQQLFNIGIESESNQLIDRIIRQKELLNLLRDSTTENRSAEVSFPSNKVYLAAISSISIENKRVGQVCMLRDVTQFKELDALKSEFVATVSHDLRTPLTLMRGYATMLEMVGQLNEQQVGYVRKIIGGVENMSRLVSNLLDLGRIEAGIGLTLDLLPVSEVIDRVVASLQVQINTKKIRIQTEYTGQSSNLMVEADPALLQQALSNLVDNAIRFNRSEGEVFIRVRPQQERVIFEIADTGIGISPMDQSRLFDKFSRGPQQGMQENHGSGLGLAIVRSIADRHHGQVWVESQLGRGSTFFFAIPLRQR